MGRFLSVAMLASAAIGSQALAATPCPPHKPGDPYPWSVDGLMSGDQWGDFSIELDAKGRVAGCKAIKGNLEAEMGFWVCRSITAQGEFNPIVKDGAAVAGAMVRHVFVEGMRHRDADAAARKRWFASHPSERSSCYPD
jgi:hypothetical protein